MESGNSPATCGKMRILSTVDSRDTEHIKCKHFCTCIAGKHCVVGQVLSKSLCKRLWKSPVAQTSTLSETMKSNIIKLFQNPSIFAEPLISDGEATLSEHVPLPLTLEFQNIHSTYLWSFLIRRTVVRKCQLMATFVLYRPAHSMEGSLWESQAHYESSLNRPL